MTPLVWVANIAGWPVLQLTISYAALRLPARWWAHDTWITAPRRWEKEGRLYRDWFAIRRWKASLPDGASWFGGFAKKKLRASHPAYLAQFLLETRRAEVAHWCMIACLPLFFLWNPCWARWVMAAYALAANLPCILVQRYNRIALGRVVRTRSRTVVLP